MKIVSIFVIVALSGMSLAQETKPAATSKPELTNPEKQRVEQYIKDLKSDDPRVMDEAFRGLANMGPKAAGAVGTLAEMLSDARVLSYPSQNITGRSYFQINVYATQTLRDIGSAAVPTLIAALENPDNLVRRCAAQGLTSQTVDLKCWVHALQNSDAGVQGTAALQLAKSKDDSAVKPLAEALQDKTRDKNVRDTAAQALGMIGSPKATDALITAMSDPTAIRCSEVLARIGRPAIQTLIERFDKFDEASRKAGAQAIRECEPQALKDLLLPCLKSKHSELRDAVLSTLIWHKFVGALEYAKEMVEDQDLGVRATAAQGLGYLADKNSSDVYQLLVKLLRDDKEPLVRVSALQSLQSASVMKPDDFWKQILSAMDDKSFRVREVAAEFWEAKLVSRLLQLLKDEAVGVRIQAALNLGSHHVKEAIPELINMLSDKNFRCATNAARALGDEGTDEAVDALAKTAKDNTLNAELRTAALAGLRKSKNPKAIGGLIDALEDEAFPKPDRVETLRVLKELTGKKFWTAADWRKWYDRQQADQGK